MTLRRIHERIKDIHFFLNFNIISLGFSLSVKCIFRAIGWGLSDAFFISLYWIVGKVRVGNRSCPGYKLSSKMLHDLVNA